MDLPLAPLLAALDLISAVSFAATGALVASRKELDILGFVWFAVITGVGGGTTRDLILGEPVFWVEDPTPVIACILTAIVTHFAAHMMEYRYRYILWLDAFGMALVSVVGTLKALDAGAGVTVAIAMGVITANVGGIIRDTLGHEPSVILRREIYVAASMLGAAACAALVLSGAGREAAALAGFGLAFTLRIVALWRSWSLPAYRSRPGRKNPPTGF
ncbi:MAG: trimeric intracellular cation channel family protein [Limimaricola soesokkakensis]|uniref:trimeric intracellular cation channel family protein n=1 Tax=Limimaricola soesokkakensis TaxID=1343159 RepID=UPI00405A1BB2